MASTVSSDRPGVLGGVLRLALMSTVGGAILFLLAGTLAWPAAWIYLAVLTTVLGIYSLILMRVCPDLIDERKHPPKDAKKWDRPFVAIIGGLGPMMFFVLCGLDHRFRWSPPLPAWVSAAGLAMVGAGGMLTNYAVLHNRFFSALVRIQRDRGHRVVDTGPYQFVRHPGYLGSILHMFGTPLALGSVWVIPLVAALSVLVGVRTALEDRTLHEELEGYAEYARHVTYRLIPLVW